MNLIQLNRIADTNDRFRKGDFSLGQILLSPKVAALPERDRRSLLSTIASVDRFVDSPTLSSRELHDLGVVMQDETQYLWEIDYCDRPDPHSAASRSPYRIMSVMRIDEY